MKIGTAVLAYNRPKHFKKVLQAIIKEKVKEFIRKVNITVVMEC